MICETERNFSKLSITKKQISINHAGGKTELSTMSFGTLIYADLKLERWGRVV
jgi:hypothetical protein